MGLVVAARRHFGSWHAALEAAGVRALRRPMRWWTREQILDWIRTRVAEGKLLRTVDVRRENPARLQAGAISRAFDGHPADPDGFFASLWVPPEPIMNSPD